MYNNNNCFLILLFCASNLFAALGSAANMGYTRLHMAVIKNDLEEVKSILGCNSQDDFDGDIAEMHISVNRHSLEAVKKQDKFGFTPLHFAAASGSYEIALVLLLKGADPVIVDLRGVNSLNLAEKYNHAEMVRLFRIFIDRKALVLAS